MCNLRERLIEKSIEAFILGLEIYNKPTIKYRIEGFSFFICNAWELMLKAELLKRRISIYYHGKNRTLSLDVTLKKIYEDKNTRIRINLEKIIELRNMSTHFVTEDYEIKYAPLFQACVLNYTNEILRFHDIDITNFIAQNFLTLSVKYEPLSNEEIRMKYPAEIAEKFISKSAEIDILVDEYKSDKFAINIRQNLYITKNKSTSDFSVNIDKFSKNNVAIIKELKDPFNTHGYSFMNIVEIVNKRIKEQHININNEKFTTHILTKLIEFYKIKENASYSYAHKIGKNIQYTYSENFLNFIIEQLKINPKLITSLKTKKR